MDDGMLFGDGAPEPTEPEEPDDGPDDEDGGGEGKGPRKTSPWKTILFLGAALLFLLFVLRACRSAPPEETAASPRPGEVVIEAELTSTAVFLDCSDCHQDLDKALRAGQVPALPTFTHNEHFKNGVSDCAACHPAKTHEPDKINTPNMTRCYWCHGEEKDSIAPGACETCHPPGFRSVPANHLTTEWLNGRHGQEAEVDIFDCTTCHTKEVFCQSCHQLEMPHPPNFEKLPHVQTYFATGMDTCGTCHQVIATSENPVDDCDECHHPEGRKNKPWVKYHPEVVKDTAQPCFECHETQTCKTCHLDEVFTLSADAVKYSVPVDSAGIVPSETP